MGDVQRVELRQARRPVALPPLALVAVAAQQRALHQLQHGLLEPLQARQPQQHRHGEGAHGGPLGLVGGGTKGRVSPKVAFTAPSAGSHAV